MTQAKQREAEFLSEAWRPRTAEKAPARRVQVEITVEHGSRHRWDQFQNAVSLAIKEHLKEDACATVYWNSDGPFPRSASDDAQVGIHTEIHDPDTGEFLHESNRYFPLPERAAREFWRMRKEGEYDFTPMVLEMDLPEEALE